MCRHGSVGFGVWGLECGVRVCAREEAGRLQREDAGTSAAYRSISAVSRSISAASPSRRPPPTRGRRSTTRECLERATAPPTARGRWTPPRSPGRSEGALRGLLVQCLGRGREGCSRGRRPGTRGCACRPPSRSVGGRVRESECPCQWSLLLEGRSVECQAWRPPARRADTLAARVRVRVLSLAHTPLAVPTLSFGGGALHIWADAPRG